jgi:hypothetical protein
MRFNGYHERNQVALIVSGFNPLWHAIIKTLLLSEAMACMTMKNGSIKQFRQG